MWAGSVWVWVEWGAVCFHRGHVCVLCMGVCVCVCVCVCVRVFVGVCVPGRQVHGNVCGCGDFVACIEGVGVALRAVSCKNGTKFVRSSHEIRANFVRISYEIRPQNTVNTYRECGCYEFRTKFVRISYKFRTICMNLYHFSLEQTHSAHSTQHSNTTTAQKNNTFSP